MPWRWRRTAVRRPPPGSIRLRYPSPGLLPGAYGSSSRAVAPRPGTRRLELWAAQAAGQATTNGDGERRATRDDPVTSRGDGLGCPMTTRTSRVRFGRHRVQAAGAARTSAPERSAPAERRIRTGGARVSRRPRPHWRRRTTHRRTPTVPVGRGSPLRDCDAWRHQGHLLRTCSYLRFVGRRDTAEPSLVADRLGLEQAGVLAVRRHELLMRSALDDFTIGHDDDQVRGSYGREPVRDQNADRVPTGVGACSGEVAEDVGLGEAVERRRGLVKHD